MSDTLAILFHENAGQFNIRKYEVTWMADFWREQGYTVHFLFGTADRVEADACILHVDLSVVPLSYRKFASRYPRVLNGQLTDIRKSRLSRNLTGPDDGWAGPVIVKTDLNFGGWPERLLAGNRLSYPLLQFARHARIGGRRTLDHGSYPVYENLGDVPAEFLQDDRFVVERFLPEIHEGLYCVNYFKFFGERFECTRRYSRSPVISGSNSLKSEVIEPHPGVLAARQALGLDFGKLDYTVCDGIVHIHDVNRTPGRQLKNSNVPIARLHHRAEGLHGLLGRQPVTS